MAESHPIPELVARRESKTLDFKRDLSSKKGIVKDIVAFANSAGGVLLIGVDDDYILVGLDDPVESEEKLANIVADNIEPQIVPDIEGASYDGKEFLLVRVPHMLGPFYLKDKGPDDGVFIRIGTTSRPAGPEMVEELRRARGNRSYDQLPCHGTSESDLSDERLQHFFDEVGVTRTAAKLRSFDILVDSGSGETIPSNGGILLFGADPLQHFPDAQIRCARFRGTTKAEVLSDIEIEGTLLEALDRAEEFITEKTDSAPGNVVKGLRRARVREYSEIIVREVLVNAVAHASYSEIGDSMLVAIFDDRLEIRSPGLWPWGMSEELLKAGSSKIRNRVIVKALRKLDYMEQLGSGYERIQAEMASGYPEPTWEEVGLSLKVTISPHPHFARAPRATPAVPRRTRRDREREILDVLGDGEKAPKEIADALGISPRQIRRKLAEMEEKRLIVPNDEARTSPQRRYRLS